MLELTSFTIMGPFFVVFLVNNFASGNSCGNTGFYPEKKGKSLEHHVIDTMTTDTASLCRIMCHLKEECMSYNYQASTGTCQISDSDEHQHSAQLVNKTDHIYVGRENPCQKDPCPPPKLCQPSLRKGSRICCCPHGYQGPTCNQDIDECKTGEHDCGNITDCVHTNGSFICQSNNTNAINSSLPVYRDCSELLSAGYTADGVYPVDPDGNGSFPVYCDMTTDGGGWTVFQRNRNDSPISFHRGWQDYKTGFGDQTVEFWLGLEKIYRLTKRQVTTLRVDVEDLSGNKGYSVYSSFSITDERDFYRLTVSGYSGSAGDSISNATNADWINNNMRFSTPDKDNDNYPSGNCADKGGWWYKWCTNSDLNGKKTWWTFSKTLNNTEMKLK